MSGMIKDRDENIFERDFQMLGYTLQGKAHTFKHTPPGFNKEILEKKRDGDIVRYIIQEEKRWGNDNA